MVEPNSPAMKRRAAALSRRRFGSLAAGGIVAALAAPMVARKASAQDLKKVVFLLDLQPYSKHALFYPGITQGFFARRGLDVQISAGKGSTDVAQKLAAKTAQFGFVDAGVSIQARGRGMPIKLVSMVHYKNMMSIIGKDVPPLKSPKDLEGRRIAAATGDSVKTAFAAVCAINGVDPGKVNFVSVENANKQPLLFAGQVDAACSYAVSLPVYQAAAGEVGMPVSQILFSDFGVDLYSNGVAVHDDLLKSDPAMVKAFNDALVESMLWAIANREEAVRILLTHSPKSNPALALQGLNVAIDHLLVPEVARHGIGPMSEDKMAATLKTIRDYFGVTAPLTTADVYANDFVTAGQKPVGM